MYEVTIKLSDILQNCNSWEIFCAEQGYDVYSVANGGGDIEVTLNKSEMVKYGLL